MPVSWKINVKFGQSQSAGNLSNFFWCRFSRLALIGLAFCMLFGFTVHQNFSPLSRLHPPRDSHKGAVPARPKEFPSDVDLHMGKSYFTDCGQYLNIAFEYLTSYARIRKTRIFHTSESTATTYRMTTANRNFLFKHNFSIVRNEAVGCWKIHAVITSLVEKSTRTTVHSTWHDLPSLHTYSSPYHIPRTRRTFLNWIFPTTRYFII